MTQNVRKRAATYVALFVLSCASPMVQFFAFLPPAFAKMRQERLTIEPKAGGSGQKFEIEIAASEQEKALGLMFRTELADGRGMLFPYKASRLVSMWMRNTYIPLDMVFIRSDGTISRIEENAEPQSDRIIDSGGPVAAVLEIPGGAAKRLGIAAGDKVRYPLFDAPAAQW